MAAGLVAALMAGAMALSFGLAGSGSAQAGAKAPEPIVRTMHRTVTIQKDGEPILHSVGGGGTLRIDPPKPAPVEVATAKPAVAPEPKPAPATAPVEKPLTRLEKLRLEHAEKTKQAAAK